MRISDWSSDVCSSDLNYSGSVTTPKIGLIYSPNNAVDLKFSWGRSFKAPTLASIYQTQYAYLLPLTYFGRSDAAPDESALYLDGGSTSLRPERATTWTATVAFHPKSLPGLNADLRSEEHTSELQSLMRISYAVFC